MVYPSLDKRLFLIGGVLVWSILPVLGWAAESSEKTSGGRSAQQTSSSERQAGSTRESLQSCMARIPKDASAGQRMMAEQSCERDEEARKPFDAIPGRAR